MGEGATRDRQRVTKLRASSDKVKARQRQNDTVRQLMIQAFVDKHAIECFACGTTAARWAKSGVNKRGAWVICVPCVARNNSKKGQQQQKASIKREKRELIAENAALHRRQRVARDRRGKGLPRG